MKKLLFHLIFLAIGSGLMLASEFTLKSPFIVDDFEEGPSNLVVTAYSSNPILFPTNQISVSGNGLERNLSLSPQVGVYGEGIINIDVTDTGIIASRTVELNALPGTVANTTWTNNFPLNPTIVTTTSPHVSISWANPPQRLVALPFIIKRSTSPLSVNPENPGILYKTVGSTYETNFDDTNVVAGTQYYYIITWVDSWSTNYFTYVPITTNYNFTMGVSPPVKLLFDGNIFGFSGKANKTYNIMTKPHMKNQVLWELINTFTLSTDQFVLLDEPIYRNKPIYVRELD